MKEIVVFQKQLRKQFTGSSPPGSSWYQEISPAQPSRKEKGRWWVQGGVNTTGRLRDGEEKLEIVM